MLIRKKPVTVSFQRGHDRVSGYYLIPQCGQDIEIRSPSPLTSISDWQKHPVTPSSLVVTGCLLEVSDNVLAVGSDVLFMNHRMTIESMIVDDRAVCSKECRRQNHSPTRLSRRD